MRFVPSPHSLFVPHPTSTVTACRPALLRTRALLLPPADACNLSTRYYNILISSLFFFSQFVIAPAMDAFETEAPAWQVHLRDADFLIPVCMEGINRSQVSPRLLALLQVHWCFSRPGHAKRCMRAGVVPCTTCHHARRCARSHLRAARRTWRVRPIHCVLQPYCGNLD